VTPSPLYPDIPPVVGKHVLSFFFDTVSFSCRQSFKFTRSKHLKTKLLPAIAVDGKYMMPVLGKWDYAKYMQARKATATDVFFLQPPKSKLYLPNSWDFLGQETFQE